jgi:hypothetical protein
MVEICITLFINRKLQIYSKSIQWSKVPDLIVKATKQRWTPYAVFFRPVLKKGASSMVTPVFSSLERFKQFLFYQILLCLTKLVASTVRN